MATIAVIHPDFSVKGGAEAVCMNVLESLQESHDVTLFTTHAPDFDELNPYYNADVGDITVRVPTSSVLLSRTIGSRLGLLKYAVLNRAVRESLHSFDLVIGTFNELGTDTGPILYFHHPVYSQPKVALDARDRSGSRDFYKEICQRIAGVTDERMRDSMALANSDWMAELVKEEYDIRPRTVYPPVDTEEFESLPFDDQENGFVSIGRFAPDKNILRNIEIIVRLHERGHDVHLHLIGPPHMSDYQQRIEAKAGEYDFIHIENEVSREELVHLINTHRYGLHGKDNEHFGMVVAEMVAGDVLPFIPDSGGQREIVNNQSTLLYGTVTEAVEKIDTVLSNSDLERDLRANLPSATERFGRTRFRNDMREVVEEELDSTHSQPITTR